MDKIIFVFNQFYYNFVDDVLQSHASTLSSEVNEHLKATAASRSSKHSAPSNTRNIDRFTRHMTNDVISALSTPSEQPVSEVLTASQFQKLSLVKRIHLSDLVSGMKDDLDMLMSYIYIFTLLGYVYVTYYSAGSCDDDSSSDEDDDATGNKKVTPEDAASAIDATLAAIKAAQKGEEIPTLEDKTSAGLMANIAKVMKPDRGSSKKVVDDDLTGAAATEMLQNTKIGNLAKEISDELDLSSLNIEKPEDLLNMGSNGILGNIIGKVGSKIHQKIDNGELKHEDLMSEAMSMMSMLGGGAGGGAGGSGAAAFLNNPMFKDIMKNMGSLGNLGNLAGLANMAKSSDKAKSAHVKDRLRKKLDERRKHDS